MEEYVIDKNEYPKLSESIILGGLFMAHQIHDMVQSVDGLYTDEIIIELNSQHVWNLSTNLRFTLLLKSVYDRTIRF